MKVAIVKETYSCGMIDSCVRPFIFWCVGDLKSHLNQCSWKILYKNDLAQSAF